MPRDRQGPTTAGTKAQQRRAATAAVNRAAAAAAAAAGPTPPQAQAPAATLPAATAGPTPMAPPAGISPAGQLSSDAGGQHPPGAAEDQLGLSGQQPANPAMATAAVAMELDPPPGGAVSTTAVAVGASSATGTGVDRLHTASAADNNRKRKDSALSGSIGANSIKKSKTYADQVGGVRLGGGAGGGGGGGPGLMAPPCSSLGIIVNLN